VLTYQEEREEEVRRAYQVQDLNLHRLHRGVGNAAVRSTLELRAPVGRELDDARSAGLVDALLARDGLEQEPADLTEPGPAPSGPGDQTPAPDPVADTGADLADEAPASWVPDTVTVHDPTSGLDISYHLAGGAPDVDLDQVRQRLGSGRPLDTDTRDYMEWRFGLSFDKVRIHTGPKANAISKALLAHAFALGPQVAFASGSYRPGTKEGDHLLAHELTHVVQAGLADPLPEGLRVDADRPTTGRRLATSPQRSATVSEPTDSFELEAERNAAEIVRVGRDEFTRWQRERDLEEEESKARRAPASELLRRAVSNPGRPLPDGLRRRLESRFGRDLSDIRIHDGPDAAAAAEALGARAATLGEHVIFSEGTFSPGTPAGDELIAHEVTHVVQHLEGREPIAGDQADDVPVTSPSSAIEAEARTEAAAFVREGPQTEQEAPAVEPEARDHAAPAAEAVVARDDTEDEEGGLTPEQQAQLDRAEQALSGVPEPVEEEADAPESAGPTDADTEADTGEEGAGDSLLVEAGAEPPAAGSRSLPERLPAGTSIPAPASGPRPVDGLVDHYMATHWDSSDFDSKVQEFGVYPDAIATELDRWLPPSVGSSTRAGANLLVGLGAGLLDSFFQEFAKSIPGVGMIAHLLVGIQNAWKDAAEYAKNDDTLGAVLIALRHTVSTVGGIAGNLADLATVAQDGAHVLAPFVAGLSEIIGVPAAAISTGASAVQSFCMGFLAVWDTALIVYNVVKANEAEAAGHFQRGAFFRGQAQTQVIRAITSVVKTIIAATSTMTVGVVPGGAPANFAQLVSSSGQKFLQSFGGIRSGSGRGVETANNAFDRFASSGMKGAGAFQGVQNLLAVTGLGDQMRRSRDGFAGGEYIDRQQLEGAGSSALSGLRDARAQTIADMDESADAMDAEKPLWHQDLVNRILTPSNVTALGVMSAVVQPSEWIRLVFGGLRYVGQAIGDGGLEAVSRIAGLAGSALSGIAQPFINNINSWIAENKPRLDEWITDLVGKLGEQRVSLQRLRDGAQAAQDFLTQVQGFANEGGTLDGVIEGMLGPLDSFNLTAGHLGIPSWVPSWIYERAISGINRAIDAGARMARDLANQVRQGIDARLDTIAEWASARVTTFQEAISEGGEVETMLNDQLAKVQEMAAEAAAAFVAWDGRIPIDLTGASTWLQNMATQAMSATTGARQERFSGYVSTVAQTYVDQWKGRYGEAVEDNWHPEMPEHEFEALSSAWTQVQGVLQPIANDASNPYSMSASSILTNAETAYNTAMGFRGQRGAGPLEGLWAAEDAFVQACTVPLEPEEAPRTELPPGGLPNESSEMDGGVQGSSSTPLRGDVSGLADAGTADAGGALPYQSQIQQSFGHHDVSSVKAHTGPDARAATSGMGADAFARGDDVAFSRQPDLHTAAHEAAHVVQQRQGVQLYGGVGTPGDRYEQQADAAADAVVSGRSAEPILDAGSGATSATHAAAPGSRPVQMKVSDTGDAFLNKGYTKQASEWDSLGGDLSTSFSQDEQEQQSKVPDIDEKMGPPSEEPAPAESEVEVPDITPEEPALDSAEPSDPEFEEVQEGEPPPMPRIGSIPGEDSGASEDEVRRVFDRALSNTPTEITDMDTSPGEPPPVTLDGNADPAQADANRDQALAAAESARADAAAAVQEIVPSEEVTYTTVTETHSIDAPDVPGIEGMAHIPEADELMGMGLPEDVKGMADDLTKDQLDASTAEARAKMGEVVSERDAEQKKLVDDANAEQARLSDEADREQQREVEGARRRIAADQGETERKQREAVADANTRSERERSQLQREVDTEVARNEREISAEFTRAEREAEAKKREKEREAEEAKREAESKSEDGGGLFGWIGDAISSAFDWLADAVNSILDALAEAVTAIIDAAKEAANALIDACCSLVTGLISAFGDFLKAMVDNLLGAIFPELAAWLNEKIDQAVEAVTAAVNWVAERLKEGINALLDGLKAGILAAIEAARAGINMALELARAALTGDWSTFARKLLEAALALAGIDQSTFDSVLNSGIDTVKKILDDPGAFIGNVIDGVGQGFSQFADNFLTHLQNGFFEWLAGPLGEGGITLPSNWDLAGIFGLVMQVLGLTQDGIRGVIEEELGEGAGVVFDYIWRYVGALITGGLEGLWEEVQSDLSNLWEMVVDGIKNWVLETIITQAVIKIASMFSPVGAIVQALVTVWNVYCFLRDNIQRIWGVVQTVVEMLANLANGIIQPAADGVENALAGLVPIAISLLANLIGLGGIGRKVKEVIESIQGVVHGAIRSLIRRVKGMFRGGGATGQEEDAAEISYAEFSFSAATAEDGGDESHRLYVQETGGQAQVMVASDPAPVAHAASDSGEFEGLDDAQTAEVVQLCQDATRLYQEAKDASDRAVTDAKDAEADAKLAAAKTILASVAAANLEARANDEGGLAVTKLGEVRGDANCSGKKDEWEQGSLARFTGGGTVISAMQDEVANSGRKYILQGPAIPESEIRAKKGLSRVVDLPAVFGYHLADAAKAKFDNDADFFATAVNAGVFDPMPHLTGRVRGRLAEGWWFARSEAPSHDLAELIEQLAVGADSPQYNAGVIRLDFTANDAMGNLQPKKPTAFDGMPFSQFQTAAGNTWGVTAGGALEAVAPDVDINAASSKTLVAGSGSVSDVATKLKEQFQTQITLIHDTAQDAVTAAFSSKAREIFDAAPSWDAVERVLKTDATLKSFEDYPARSHAFGDHVTGTLAPPKLTEALADAGITLADLGESSTTDWITKRKGAISAGSGRYATPKQKLGEAVWDKTKETEAASALKSAFESTLTETKRIHDKYRPQNVTDPVDLDDGGKRFEYDGYDGAHFTVTHDADEMVSSITGTGLTLKGTQDEDVTGRGMTSTSGNRNTSDPQGTPEDERLLHEASHLIADRFRGSGYKRGCNLVTTSAHYNDPIMKDIEDQIAAIAETAVEMTLTVSVDWIEWAAPSVIRDIMRTQAAAIGADLTDADERRALTERVERELEERFQRLRSENTKRVKNVTYTATFKMRDGSERNENWATNQVDTWM